MKHSIFATGYYSTPSVEIEADSKEEAEDIFWNEYADTPSICHHCTKEAELGDLEKAHIYDAD